MKSIVPYTKDIKFANKVAEICSISLEHEINIKDTEIEGNFIISGEYKTHKVSVNKDDFSFELPFNVDVTDNIVKDSIEFEVTDFTYELLGEDLLRVEIEFCVTAEEKKEIEEEIEMIEEVEEVEEQDQADRIDVFDEINDLFSTPINLEENIDEEKNNEIIEEESNDEQNENEEEERLDQESAKLILESANAHDDEYTTYYIHLVKTGDTLESIVANYQTDLDTLKKYNTIENINIGDKLIIPSLDE